VTVGSVVSLQAPRAARPGRELLLGLAALGTCACTAAVAVVAHGAPRDEALARAVMAAVLAGAPIAAGLYALATRPGARLGAVLIAAGLAWSVTALAESQDGLAYSTGRVAAWLVVPWLVLLLLAFPTGRVEPGSDRGLLRALDLVLALALAGSALCVERYPELTPWASCRAACPPNAFLVLSSEPAAMRHVAQPLGEFLSVVALAGVVASMAWRWRAATPLRRRTIGPVVVAAAASAGLLAAFFIARRAPAGAGTAETLGVLWVLTLPAVAVACLAGLLRRQLMLGEALRRLGDLLGRPVGPAAVRAAVAAALADPALDVLVPSGPALWRDGRGRHRTDLAVAAKGRAVTVVWDDGAPALALLHDPELAAEDDLLHAVGSLVIAALRHDRLTTRLAASLAELESSRRRIATAADVERSRIERDLHDGAQQRLIALRLRLSLAEELMHSDPEAAAAAVAALGDEVEVTLDEMRSLAHGVYPSILRDRGIVQALRSLAAGAPLPLHLRAIGVTRQPLAIDAAVYFTCVEAVQNAVKHAGTATGVWIVLRQREMLLTVDVRDDGPGFDPPPAYGNGRTVAGGLRNMRDRIEAVGGRLTIESTPGRGTHVIAHVPLG
jgi:signal transduction histidine kinase